MCFLCQWEMGEEHKMSNLSRETEMNLKEIFRIKIKVKQT